MNSPKSQSLHILNKSKNTLDRTEPVLDEAWLILSLIDPQFNLLKLYLISYSLIFLAKFKNSKSYRIFDKQLFDQKNFKHILCHSVSLKEKVLASKTDKKKSPNCQKTKNLVKTLRALTKNQIENNFTKE